MPSWTTPIDFATLHNVTNTEWNTLLGANGDVAYLYGDTGWTNVATFTNSWVSAGSPAAGYILLGRVVFLRGAVSGGTAATTAFTLPAGYRPSGAANFFAVINSAATVNRIEIDSTGAVVPLNTGAAQLSSISFPVV